MSSTDLNELKNLICDLTTKMKSFFEKIESGSKKIELGFEKMESGSKKTESGLEKINSKLEKIEINTDQNNWNKNKYNRLKKVACKMNNCNGFIGFLNNKLLAGTANQYFTKSDTSNIKIEVNQELYNFLNENKIDLNNLSFECFQVTEHGMFVIEFDLHPNYLEKIDEDFLLNFNNESKISEKVMLYTTCNQGVEILTGNIVGKKGHYYVCDNYGTPGLSGSIVSNSSSLVGIVIGEHTIGEEYVFQGEINGIFQLNQILIESIIHELKNKKTFVLISDFNQLSQINDKDKLKYLPKISINKMD